MLLHLAPKLMILPKRSHTLIIPLILAVSAKVSQLGLHDISGHLILSFWYKRRVEAAEAASMMIEEDILAWPLLCIVACGGVGGGG